MSRWKIPGCRHYICVPLFLWNHLKQTRDSILILDYFNIRFLYMYQFPWRLTVCVVGQFYPKFKFYFPLIKTYYHTLLYKKKTRGKRIILNHNIYFNYAWSLSANGP